MPQRSGRRSVTTLVCRLLRLVIPTHSTLLCSQFLLLPSTTLVQTSATTVSAFSPAVHNSLSVPSNALIASHKLRHFHSLSASFVQSQSSSQLPMSILESPSADRNKGPIWDVLSSFVMPTLSLSENDTLRVLEVAAGCGVHTQHFVSLLIDSGFGQRLQWHPTDPEAQCRDSIDLRVNTHPSIDKAIHLRNCVVPASSLTLDDEGAIEMRQSQSAKEKVWEDLTLIMCINMIHISPWGATVGLMKLAGLSLKKGGILYCYGPYKVNGAAVPSNMSFDQSLKSRNSSWGLRDLEEVEKEAELNGLKLIQKVEMPANNLSIIFHKG